MAIAANTIAIRVFSTQAHILMSLSNLDLNLRLPSPSSLYLLLLMHTKLFSSTTHLVFFAQAAKLVLTTLSLLLDTVLKTARNTTSSKTPGALAGVQKVTVKSVFRVVMAAVVFKVDQFTLMSRIDEDLQRIYNNLHLIDRKSVV